MTAPSAHPLPDTTTPLVRAGGGEKSQAKGLQALVGLVGNWHSLPGAAATGSNTMPVPAVTPKVMPVPPADIKDGYQMLNTEYFEQMTISALPGTAANRGGTFEQVASPLFYEQRVYFTNNSAELDNTLVHAENGSWLHFVYADQFGEPPTTGQQPAATAYVKQVSVPHGNDVLAVGASTGPYQGPPRSFPQADHTVLPYSDPSRGVPDPNAGLQLQLDALGEKGVTVVSTTEITVDTDNPGGAMTDIEFEQRHATVTRFASTFYIEELSDGTTQLQYSQSMWMDLVIGDVTKKFVHIDANTLVRVP